MDQANVTRFDRWMVTIATALVVLVYALRGGSFDIVARHQAALALWGALLLAFGVGVAVRRSGPRALLIPAAALLLLTGWTALSLLWTSSAERTLLEVARVAQFAGLLLIARAALTRTNWTGAAAGAAIGAVIVCLLAVLSRVQPGWFPEDVTALVFGVQRLGYPFDYWNALAAWAAMSTAVSLAWSAHAPSLAIRMAASAALPVCVLAAYLTYSRAGILGMLLGAGVVLALSRNRWSVVLHLALAAPASLLAISAARQAPEVAFGTGSAGAGGVVLVLVAACALAAAAPVIGRFARTDRLRMPRRRAQRTLAVASVLVAIPLLVVIVTEAPGAWKQFRTTESAAINDPRTRLTSLSGARYALWSEALDLGAENPFKGIGAGTFEFAWSQNSVTGGFERDAHSLYLEQLGELGIPGALLLLGALGSLLVLALRSRRHLEDARDVGVHTACVAAFVVFCFHAGLDWMWESTAVTVLGLLLGAIALAPSLGQAFVRLPVPARVAGAVLAAVLIAVQLPALAMTQRVRESREAFTAGRTDEALREADRAIRAQPWAASPYGQRAGVAEAAGDFDAAARDLGRAIEREPTNWRHPLLLSRVEANRGNGEAALRWFRRAKELRPRSRFYGEAESGN